MLKLGLADEIPDVRHCTPLRCKSVGGMKGFKMKEVGEMGAEEVGLEGGVGEEGDGVGGRRG